MTLYSPFDSSSLPMLRPLLYLSPSLTPLRPYSNAVLARLIRPDIDLYGHPSPRWFVKFDKPETTLPSRGTQASDLLDGHAYAEIQHVVDRDPRLTFGETEFQTLRQKYNMPKNVHPSKFALMVDSCSMPRAIRL